jgi:hypothetical protein
MVKSTASLSSGQDMTSTMQELVSAAPLSSAVIQKARLISQALARSKLEILHSASQHLLLNFVLWDWLERQVMESIPHSALGRLRLKIKELSKTTPVESEVIDAANYFEDVSPETITYTLSLPRRANHLPSPAEINETTITVLADWFQMPLRSREKAWFIRCILQSPLRFVGLHLEPIVNAASSVSSHIFNVRYRVVDEEHVQRWSKESLLVHPICDVSSEHFARASQIAKDLSKVDFLDLNLAKQVEKALRPMPRLPSSIQVPNPPPVLLSQPAPAPSSLNQPVFNDLVMMLRGLKPMISADFVGPSRSLQKVEADASPAEKESALHNTFLAHVFASSDKLLPFRNSAASRRRVLLPGGPYSPEHVRTKSGLFSALVYRGITHNTRFLQDNKTLFRDLDDWNSTLEEPRNVMAMIQHGKTYFCRSDAYGQAAKARSIENAEGYWKLVSEDPTFSDWLTSPQPVSILDLFSKIKKACYGFGPLTTLQLINDYVECGLVQEPTIEEMATLICKLKMGGSRGLQALGYDVGSPTRVLDALRSLRSDLMNALTAEERLAMGFGVIMIEHSLCKLGRLDTKPFQQWRDVATDLTLS